MLVLITMFSSRKVADKTYADLHGVKCKATSQDGAKGCETFQYRADPSAIEGMRKVPGIYDIEVDVQTFGKMSTVKATNASYVGAMSEFTFGIDGINKREPAAAAARQAATA